MKLLKHKRLSMHACTHTVEKWNLFFINYSSLLFFKKFSLLISLFVVSSSFRKRRVFHRNKFWLISVISKEICQIHSKSFPLRDTLHNEICFYKSIDSLLYSFRYSTISDNYTYPCRLELLSSKDQPYCYNGPLFYLSYWAVKIIPDLYFTSPIEQ